ncbi:hypothetical protein K435DRAFT_759496 [Dendrothele bispora CBS 962.96]|uniref:CHAT domain-containing protein n=1 Tax=Dendrothele bispora (strain CBS 962.96) TaxID=1314807 RepID=A0A4S8LPE8_DENBC|nr:hypothetical protein K435DRAFT_759496 [Dendrothele bispora CBS 962.96]
MSDIELLIDRCRESLALSSSNGIDRVRPLHELAVALRCRYDQENRLCDLEEAIDLSVEAEAIANFFDHPYLTWFHHATVLQTRFDSTGAQIDRTSHKLTAYTNSSAVERFHLAVALATAARSRTAHHAIRAYKTALLLAERCLNIRFCSELQYQFIIGDEYRPLAGDAASCAIEHGDLELAVELLEQGRSQLFTRMQDYSFPLSTLVDTQEDLAHEFGQTLVRMELVFQSLHCDTQTNENRTQGLSEIVGSWNELLSKIRALEGFSDVLQPRSFASIRHAAAEGPVIILNISKYRCDALILLQEVSRPILVPLSMKLHQVLPRLSKTMARIKEHARASRPYIGNGSPTKAMTTVLAELWAHVVYPVVTQLQTINLPRQSRIWWCPTGTLSSLPLHAAGDYKNDGECLPNIYVSSYTPTLSSIIRARTSLADLSGHVRGDKLLAIGQSTTLSHVKAEFDILRTLFSDDVIIKDGPDATPDAVFNALHDHAWLHFACHGTLNIAQPLRSHFILHGGNLILNDIAGDGRLSRSGVLAFLAACNSATGDMDQAPDENISMAGAMQSIGFRSVIGTLWAMSDRDGPSLSQDFYGHLIRKGVQNLQVKDSALALHLAVNAMREKGIPPERWATFIHVGI